MVTEQPASPCVPWPSLISESKITAGTTLGRWREVREIEKGGRRWSGRSRGRLRGKLGEVKEGKVETEEREEASDIYVPGQDKMPLQPGMSLSFSASLSGLLLT